MKTIGFWVYSALFCAVSFADTPIEFPLRGPDGEWILNRGVACIAFSPDEKYLAIGNCLGIFLEDFRSEIPAIQKWIPLNDEIPLLFQFSSDGKKLLTFNRSIGENLSDYSMHLWNLELGKIDRSFLIPQSRLRTYRNVVITNTVLCMAFSPDQSLILTGNGDSTATLFDIASATPVLHLDAHSVKRIDVGYDSGTTAVAFSPDGKFLMTGGWDGAIKQWDRTTGAELRQWNAHLGSIRKICFTRDSSRFLSCSFRRSDDCLIHLWDWSSGQLIASASGHATVVQDFQFLPGEQHFISVAKDGILKEWETDTGRELRSIPTNLLVLINNYPQSQSTLLSPQGHYLYTSSAYYHSQLWSIANLDAIESKSLNYRSFSKCAISPDNRFFVIPDNDMVLFWEMTGDQTTEEKPVITRQIRIPDSQVQSLSFSPDGHYLLTVSYHDNTARIWDLNTLEIAQSIGRDDMKPFSGVDYAEFSPDGQLIVTDGGGSIHVWDWKTKSQIQSFLVDGYAPAWGSISPDGKSILTGHANHSKIAVRLWDLESGALLWIHKPEQESLRPLQNPLNGQWGFAGFVEDENSETVTIAFWDGYTDEEQHFTLKTPSLLELPVFSKDGRHAFGVYDEGIQMFDVRTGGRIRSFGKSYTIALSNDGLRAVTTGYGIGRIWNLALSSAVTEWQSNR